MSAHMVSQWAGAEKATLGQFMWVQPGANPRTAASSGNPLLAVPLAALIAVAPIHASFDLTHTIQLAPISSTIVHLNLPQRTWVPAQANSEISFANVTPTLIDGIRSNFGFSDNSLGEIFGVSRQTIYNWRTKKTVADNPERLRAFAESLGEVALTDMPYMKRVLFYPTADGRLIQDVLSDDGWATGGEKAVHQLIHELAAKAQQLRERDQKTIARLERSESAKASDHA